MSGDAIVFQDNIQSINSQSMKWGAANPPDAHGGYSTVMIPTVPASQPFYDTGLIGTVYPPLPELQEWPRTGSRSTTESSGTGSPRWIQSDTFPPSSTTDFYESYHGGQMPVMPARSMSISDMVTSHVGDDVMAGMSPSQSNYDFSSTPPAADTSNMGSAWPPSSAAQSSAPPLPPSARDAWTRQQETYLMDARRNGSTFDEIRKGMIGAFGVERNVNILSKKHRALLQRELSRGDSVSLLANLMPQH
jgi:hypothetical protein